MSKINEDFANDMVMNKEFGIDYDLSQYFVQSGIKIDKYQKLAE